MTLRGLRPKPDRSGGVSGGSSKVCSLSLICVILCLVCIVRVALSGGGFVSVGEFGVCVSSTHSVWHVHHYVICTLAYINISNTLNYYIRTKLLGCPFLYQKTQNYIAGLRTNRGSISVRVGHISCFNVLSQHLCSVFCAKLQIKYWTKNQIMKCYIPLNLLLNILKFVTSNGG